MKKILFMLLSFAFITSCADEELGPILTYEKAEVGSYIRLVQLNVGEFDLDNASTSALDYEVDFVDIENGKLADEYSIDVVYQDNTPADGPGNMDRRSFKVFSKGDFSDSVNGNKGVKVTIPLTEVLSLFGLSLDQVKAGDNFAFFGTVRQGDDTYASTNSTSTIRGSAFQGYFDFNGKLTCPQPNTVFVGSYTISFEGDVGLGYGAPYIDGDVVEVSAIPGSSTLRQFAAVVLPGIGGFGPYTTKFALVCDKTEFVLMDSEGLGCGGGGIMFGPPKDANGLAIGAPLDLTDDSSIKLIFNEGFSSGGCGGQTGATESVMILTKS